MGGSPEQQANGTWLNDWLRSVADGESTMSQRALSSIEKNGGIEAAVEAARTLGVHLVQLTDDKEKVLIAASKNEFKPLC